MTNFSIDQALSHQASHRRAFIKSALKIATGGAGFIAFNGMSLPTWASSQANLQVTELSPTVVLLTGAGCNVVVVKGMNGIALVDGGLREHSDDLTAAALKAMSAKRVDVLFNTHWHPEQTGSNEKLGKAGTKIIAHENTKLWLGYRNPTPWAQGEYGPLSPKALPNETIYTKASMTVGSEHIDYGYLLQAHTDGDIYVHCRDSNVLVTGGVVSGAGWPVIDYGTGGWMGGMIDALRTVSSLCNDTTKIIPANGPVLTKADLETQRAMYATIFDRLQKAMRKGLGPDETLATEPAKEFEAKWGDSKQFVVMAFKSMWGHLAPDA
jgi:cyclase